MSLEKSLELDVIINEIALSCSFSLGEKIIHDIKPSYNTLVIKRENALIFEALQATIKYGPMPFYGMHDLTDILNTCNKGRTLSGHDLVLIASFISGLKAIIAYDKAIEFPHEALNEYISSLTIHTKVYNKITSCINDYGEVMDSASSKLASIRASLRNADHVIEEAMNKFIAANPSSVVDGIVTVRNGRSVVLVKVQDKNIYGGLVYGDSSSGQASYIEPPSVVRANNHKMELLSEEEEEVNRILRECSDVVKEYAMEELANLNTCAILDALFAKAIWGKNNNATVTKLTDEKIIDLKKARHPLIDKEKVIANNYHLADPQRTLLITGPNTGGKTVSMKIIGLFVLMTYCGIPLTCDEAIIPFFDQVFADIGDDQSVVSSLSSFSAHTKKQAEIAKYATCESLVLLDEVGSGTDPQEGESLAIALLNELRNRKVMTIATTHYSRLKAYGKRHDDILLASVEFDMQKLEPTYRYFEGITGQSNAFEVALRYGLPKGIVKYARFLKNQAKTEEDTLIENLDKELKLAHQKEEEYTRRLNELEEEKKKLENDRKNFNYEKEKWKDSLEIETNKYLEEAKKQADDILKEMRLQRETVKYHEALNIRNKLQVQNDSVNDDSSDDASFKIGDIVELKNSNQVARVVSIRKKNIVINMNGREVVVKANQIRHSLKVLPKEKDESTLTVMNKAIFSSMPLECNLIGLHVDEAIDKMEDYLDEARLHGLTHFRIIHGDGSGALRKAVHNNLQKNKYVDSFRLGMPQEGGTGATVVEMKK